MSVIKNNLCYMAQLLCVHCHKAKINKYCIKYSYQWERGCVRKIVNNGFLLPVGPHLCLRTLVSDKKLKKITEQWDVKMIGFGTWLSVPLTWKRAKTSDNYLSMYRYRTCIRIQLLCLNYTRENERGTRRNNQLGRRVYHRWNFKNTQESFLQNMSI